ncbi:hypothetical protein RJT34_09913 [Clitoria ternatea]|uniref:VQ domain-containing protein n=1 Tax=Clitoria ternatea TaxID=43366 RepID=A0AAN9PVD6_CLITE
MDNKSCQSSAESTNTTSSVSVTTSSATNTTRDHYLRHLNKLSQKISKPLIKKPTFDSSSSSSTQPPVQPQPQQNLQHQPPVYNINKNDFRDVVQKLTGSPAHDRISTPPPIQQPKPPSSRLQRIRPPPLPQITNRPPPLLNARPLPLPNGNVNVLPFNNFSAFGRPLAPLSPLPPFPTVHAPAESPISAYMRDLQNLASTVDSNSKQFSGFSPLAPPVQPQPPQEQQSMVPSATAPPPASMFQMPSSPASFGCLNSQLSSYPLLSPGLLFSPNSGQLGFPQLPLSPTVPVPSPRWRGI